MGELLRRGFDAQLADRNTKGYDIIAGVENGDLKRLQVKTVRVQPWFVNRQMFESELSNRLTVFVLLGREDARKPVRFFIAKNRDLAKHAHYPEKWKRHGFIRLAAVQDYENQWEILKS